MERILGLGNFETSDEAFTQGATFVDIYSLCTPSKAQR